MSTPAARARQVRLRAAASGPRHLGTHTVTSLDRLQAVCAPHQPACSHWGVISQMRGGGRCPVISPTLQHAPQARPFSLGRQPSGRAQQGPAGQPPRGNPPPGNGTHPALQHARFPHHPRTNTHTWTHVRTHTHKHTGTHMPSRTPTCSRGLHAAQAPRLRRVGGPAPKLLQPLLPAPLVRPCHTRAACTNTRRRWAMRLAVCGLACSLCACTRALSLLACTPALLVHESKCGCVRTDAGRCSLRVYAPTHMHVLAHLHLCSCTHA